MTARTCLLLPVGGVAQRPIEQGLEMAALAFDDLAEPCKQPSAA